MTQVLKSSLPNCLKVLMYRTFRRKKEERLTLEKAFSITRCSSIDEDVHSVVVDEGYSTSCFKLVIL